MSFASKSLKLKNDSVEYNDDVSDHGYVSGKFSILTQKPPPRTYRPFNDFNIETYNSTSSITPWNFVLQCSDVDDNV